MTAIFTTAIHIGGVAVVQTAIFTTAIHIGGVAIVQTAIFTTAIHIWGVAVVQTAIFATAIHVRTVEVHWYWDLNMHFRESTYIEGLFHEIFAQSGLGLSRIFTHYSILLFPKFCLLSFLFGLLFPIILMIQRVTMQ